MSKKNQIIIFVLGFAVFAIFRVGYVALPLTVRDQPVELDDAYTYAWKAVNFTNCFFSDCPAQQDLWQQYFAPAENEQLAKARRRAATFTFHRYTFLHEAILSAVYALGYSWATTLIATAVVGICLIVLALGYWLYALWGPAAAGIALAAVAPIMKWQDIQIIVPFVLTLAIAAFVWGLILRNSRFALIATPLAACLLMLMHPVGRVWSVVSVVLLLSQCELRNFKARLFASLVTIVLVVLAFIVPLFVRRPVLNEWDLPHLIAYQWKPHFEANLHQVFGAPLTQQFFFSIFEWLVLLCGFIFSLLLSKYAQRRTIFVMGAALGGLLLISIFHVWPGYPALLFGRIWTPVALFFFAAGAYTVLQLPGVSRQAKPAFVWMLRLYSLCFFALIVSYWVDQIPKDLKSLEARTYKHAFELDTAQPEILKAKAESGGRVLYLDEEPMIFHLNYGAHRLGAVFWPVVGRSAIEREWIRDIDFVVGFNKPLQQMSAAMKFPEGIYFDSFSSLLIETNADFNLRDVEIALEDRSSGKDCQISWELAELKGVISATTSEWQQISADKVHLTSQLKLSAQTGDCQFTRLLGLRLDPQQKSNWPWSFAAKLSALFVGESKERISYFSTDKMLRDRGLEGYLDNELSSLDVLADSGSLVLLSKRK